MTEYKLQGWVARDECSDDSSCGETNLFVSNSNQIVWQTHHLALACGLIEVSSWHFQPTCFHSFPTKTSLWKSKLSSS